MIESNSSGDPIPENTPGAGYGDMPYDKDRKVVDTVELDLVYKWTCLKCGQINTDDGTPLPTDMVDPVQLRRFKRDFGLSRDDAVPDGTFTSPPWLLSCARCGCDWFGSYGDELQD